MNDTWIPPPVTTTNRPSPRAGADPSLRPGARLDTFEIQRVIARSSSTIVYLAADHTLAMPVAIQEYLPARLVERSADQHLRAVDTWHEEVVARGRRAFIDETRMLAHCDHPALLRISHLREANGTAYRVMPFYRGQRLLDLRREMTAAPDEGSLRALLDGLLGALASIHRTHHVHGGVTPANILLLSDDRPLLLGPGAAAREIGSDLVESLMSGLQPSFAPAPADVAAAAPAEPAPMHAADDLYALAAVLRFCISGQWPAAQAAAPREHEPLAAVIARTFEPAVRPTYSAALVSTLDAALSPFADDRPGDAAQFREWLVHGAPARSRPAAPSTQADDPVSPTLAAEPAAIDDDPAWIPTRMMPPRPLPRAASDGGRLRTAMRVAGLGLLTAMLIGLAAFTWKLWPTLATRASAMANAAPDPVVADRATPADPPPAVAAQLAPQPAARNTMPQADAPDESALTVAPATTRGIVAAAPPQAPPAAAAPPPVLPTPPAPRAAAPAPRPVVVAAGPAAAPAATGNPRALCAPKTEFSLYRCMQTLCRGERWAEHSQCVRLRATDQVE